MYRQGWSVSEESTLEGLDASEESGVSVSEESKLEGMNGAGVALCAVPRDAVNIAMARRPKAGLTGWLAPVPHGIGARADATASGDARVNGL